MRIISALGSFSPSSLPRFQLIFAYIIMGYGDPADSVIFRLSQQDMAISNMEMKHLLKWCLTSQLLWFTSVLFCRHLWNKPHLCTESKGHKLAQPLICILVVMFVINTSPFCTVTLWPPCLCWRGTMTLCTFMQNKGSHAKPCFIQKWIQIEIQPVLNQSNFIYITLFLQHM